MRGVKAIEEAYGIQEDYDDDDEQQQDGSLTEYITEATHSSDHTMTAHSSHSGETTTNTTARCPWNVKRGVSPDMFSNDTSVIDETTQDDTPTLHGTEHNEKHYESTAEVGVEEDEAWDGGDHSLG